MLLLENIFSVKNEYDTNYKKKVVTILGIKISHRLEKLKSESQKSIYADFIPKEGYIYKENPEYGFGRVTEQDKINDINHLGIAFEYEEMLTTNKGIGDNFLFDAQTIVNIGAGIGTFENYAARLYPEKQFVASEFDKESIEYAKRERALDNVTFCSETMQTLLDKYKKFDIAVSVDVLEHVKDYKSFLDDFSKLADTAVIATPNRDRYSNKESLVSPPYEAHVQEWNAGELYFILKMYYKTVKLYSFPEPYSPEIKEVGLYSGYNKLIAYCKK